VEERARQVIRFDLAQFKLHIRLKPKAELTLHFDSPSRRFYLSVMALVVNEMKRLGKITSIPLETHIDQLILLNETIGDSAGSSEKESLIRRIYKKWRDALPDLENAPLFKVVGRRKEEDGTGKTYRFSEAEKDTWANLFEYKGSEEHVRLRFSIDKLGAGLDDAVIIYEDARDQDAWERFISNLRKKSAEAPKATSVVTPLQEPSLAVSSALQENVGKPRRHRNIVLIASLVVVIGIAAFVLWHAFAPNRTRNLASVEKMAFPLPDKPSIAVLPFANMSDDPKQEYLADGFAEEIINGLSKCPHIMVIARNSSFTFKGKSVKVQQVAEELGVRYVLEGSLRRTGDKVRIALQLIDALTAQHLFSERYDRELKDILVIQDEITMKILDAVQVKLTAGEDARLRAKGTTNLEAYLKLVQARQYMQTYNKGNYAVARELTEQALALDPHYAAAYATLSRVQLMETIVGVYKNPRETLAQAAKVAEKAITLDDSNALAHAALSGISVWLRDYGTAIAEAEKAVSLDPNSAYACYALGSGLEYAGRPQEAIPFLNKSLRLTPIPVETSAFIRLGSAYRQLGQYEQAEAVYKKALQLYGADDLLVHVGLAGTYVMMGRDKEARAETAEILRIDPTFSAISFASRNPWKDQKINDGYVSALRRAGLK
jgi:adenylate cyclase